jgi:anaerobic ribonucleoside-triphosphate reductase activating protein
MRPEYKTSVERIITLVDGLAKGHWIDGFTITGGEPMDQADELALLTVRLKQYSDDILIYTGYTKEQLEHRGDQGTDFILNESTVLIDGPYIRGRNTGLVLRGSDNQRILILNERFKQAYESYTSGTVNQIQNFATTDGMVSVGIHRSDFLSELTSKIKNER